MKHCLTRSGCRIYCFVIDDEAPLRQMYKTELPVCTFPRPAPMSRRNSLRYLIECARQSAPYTPEYPDDYRERLCLHPDTFVRPDVNTYLTDVLHGLGYHDTFLVFTPPHVAAILHFLGPRPDIHPPKTIENIL